MATDSLKSTKPGDAQYKVKPTSFSDGDKKQAIMNGGHGGGTKGGFSQDTLKAVGRSAARAAASGKAY